MADDGKEGEGTSSRGADWEVVSLTASAYAAAPGPKQFDPADESKDKEPGSNKNESSGAMFMSGHFVFPPSEHENLPIEPDYNEIHNEPGDQDVSPAEEEGSKTHEENWNIKGITDDDLHESQFFDKETSLPVQGLDFEERKMLQELNLVGKEHGIYSGSGFSYHSETDITSSIPFDESTGNAEPNDPSQRNLDSPPDFSNASKSIEQDKYDASGLPCEAWWKRQAASLYSHAKETNTLWSVFVAAALMGLVILGQRWQRENLQIRQLKCQFSVTDERMNRVLGPINRFKKILVGSHQRSPPIRGGASPSR